MKDYQQLATKEISLIVSQPRVLRFYEPETFTSFTDNVSER